MTQVDESRPLTREENDLLTQTGPGTPGGELLRRYWQPVALSEELPPSGAPRPVRIMSEDLVLFRDDGDRLGLLGLHCAHRGADLSYGRLEDGGLRCIYHGWLYDVSGRCLEQPGEPAGSTFHERLRHRAYPCREVGGIIFAYMGPGEPPLFPAYEPLLADEGYRVSKKRLSDCNYLQSHEGNLDPEHLSFLHHGLPRREGNFYSAPPIVRTEETPFGGRVYSIRPAPDGMRFVKTTCFVMPNINATGPDHGGFQMGWHVPIDDFSHWRYSVGFRRTAPMDELARTESVSEIADGYRHVRNRANRYLQDREAMKTWSYSGIGTSNGPQDACVQEGMGAIEDRTEEHLGTTDQGVLLARDRLLRAIQDVLAGRDPPHVVRDETSNHHDIRVVTAVIPGDRDWYNFWESSQEAGVVSPFRALRAAGRV
ncbi:MAG: phthalate 4,5-dioxygenase [Chloroflexi bacterium]|nr:phthalate 4,5-dioxygenase [Chloroflexota bacterium]